jgi:hypothetical protein
MLLALCDHSASLEDHIRLVTKVQADLEPGNLDMFNHFLFFFCRGLILSRQNSTKRRKKTQK